MVLVRVNRKSMRQNLLKKKSKEIKIFKDPKFK